MIVFDIETTGLDSRKHQMVSIGAVDSKTGETFYEECRICAHDEISPEALKVNSFTEEQVRDQNKQTPKELYDHFLDWSSKRSNTIMSCNISFDTSFLRKVNHEAGYDFGHFPFRRCLDLYTMSFCKFGEPMGMKAICKRLNIEPEPEIHNALNGALKAKECLELLTK